MLDQGAVKDPVRDAEDDESRGGAAQESGSEDSFGVSKRAKEEGGAEGKDVGRCIFVVTPEKYKKKWCLRYHWLAVC